MAFMCGGCGLLAGCSSASPQQAEFSDSMNARPSMANISATHIGHDAATPRTAFTGDEFHDDNIVFTAPAENPHINPRPHADRDHTTALIGLYGELVGGTPDAGAQF